MSETDDPLRRLVAQVGLNTDVLVGGTPSQARRLLSEAAVALAGHATVVSVASAVGELGLSALIAQLAGRPDLEDQDDAVLELGLKRLTGDGQTVLMLLTPAGISRSALRYVQHVSSYSAGLAIVIYNVPSLALAMLEEPGLATLRARLYAAPVIEFEAPAEAAGAPPVTVAAPVPVPVPGARLLPIVEARRRRPVLWAASALGAAAIAGVIWFVHSTPGTAAAGSQLAGAGIPLVPAAVPGPVLAGMADPVAVKLPPADAVMTAMPPLATMSPSATVKLAPVTPAKLPAQPPAVTSSHSEMVVAGLVQPQPRADRTARRPERREASRSGRARPSLPPPRYQEPWDYESARPWDGVSPVWSRRDSTRRGSPYLGTYGADANGVRVFEYDP